MKRWLRRVGTVIAVAVFGWILLPKPPLLDGVPFSREVYDCRGERLAVSLSADDKVRLYTPLAAIAPELIAATLAHEDRWFSEHPGVNPVALARSTLRFACRGQARLGASTITMQVARLRFRLRTRTVAGKLQQIVYALELERHYSKAQILEAYFNLAPYGGNLEGAGAASLAIFRKAPAELSRYEALALSLIPQSPARRAPFCDRENPALQAAIARVAAARGLPEAGSFRVLLRGIPPAEAPHFVRQALRKNSADVVQTTLDRKLQRIVQDRLGRYVRGRSALGFHNAAALLLDWRLLDVLAQVGSADFHDASIQGQVDGTHALRSPGSALKPLVYALAMQQGLIHPDSIVLDAPRSFAGYNPENSDREFAGPLRATDALARSRNIPAVELAGKLCRPTLYGFLKTAGLPLPQAESWYGLALPLGSAEVRMDDLARLYALLANNGRLAGRQLLAPEAAFLALEMIGRVPPPPGHSVSAPVFWKTGTSHGYHDAWSVGVCGPYVLAVWVGNFNGRANPAFMGRTAAGPLFFQILEDLESSGRLPRVPHEPPSGANLRQVELCAESGQLPGAFCPHRIEGWFIPGVSAIATCTLHQPVIVDARSGLRLLADDGSRPVRHEVYEFWPADIQKLFAQAGLPRRQPPPFAPGQMTNANSSASLKIVSPRPGAIYTRSAGGAELALAVNSDANTRHVYWFDGARFLGSCAPEKSLTWEPSGGAHQVTAIDQDGRQAIAAIRVEVVAAGR